MHQNQRERLVQQIAIMLRMSQPAVSTTLEYYRHLAAQTTDYPNEVMVCAAAYLAAKVFEDQRKIRDILNTIYSAITLYTMAAGESDGYIDLGRLPQEGLQTKLEPKYDLNMYNQLKKKVLEAEQQLLRILKFDFQASDTKSQNFKQLLALCDTLGLSSFVTQIAVNTFNDLELTEQVAQWIPGILYFSVQVQQCSQDMQQSEEIAWEQIFLVPLKKLQAYSGKVIQYYEQLGKEEHQQQNQ